MHALFLAIAVGCLLAWVAVSAGLVPSPFCRVLVRVAAGEARVVRGALRAQQRMHLTDVIRESGLRGGFITLSSGNAVTFSLGIPGHLRQRLRNILLN